MYQILTVAILTSTLNLKLGRDVNTSQKKCWKNNNSRSFHLNSATPLDPLAEVRNKILKKTIQKEIF